MPQLLLPDVIAGIIVAGTFLTGLWIAYRRGFRAALPVHSGALDFLATDLSLHDSRWRLDLESAASLSVTTPSSQTLHLQQAGSRIVGTGRRADGIPWQLEGIVSHRQVTCMTHGLESDTPGPGLLMLRADADGKTLTGYRIAWDRQGSLLSLRELTLVREAPIADPPIREISPVT